MATGEDIMIATLLINLPSSDLSIVVELAIIAFLVSLERGILDQRAGNAPWWKRPALSCGALVVFAISIGMMYIGGHIIDMHSTWTGIVWVVGYFMFWIGVFAAGFSIVTFYIGISTLPSRNRTNLRD